MSSMKAVRIHEYGGPEVLKYEDAPRPDRVLFGIRWKREALYADSEEDHHRPPGRLIALAGEGKLGRKAGAGFFDYSDR